MVPDSITRRTILQSGGVAATAVLAGCTSFQVSVSNDSNRDEEKIRIGRLGVTNYHKEPHVVNILILESGEPAYWKAIDLKKYDENTDQGSGKALKDIPEKEADYVILARLEDWPPDKWKRADFNEDSGCIAVRVLVGSPGIHDKENLSIARSLDCGTTTESK